MKINSQRRGIALGAILALVASLFGLTAPASAATDGANVAVTPAAGATTNFNGVIMEDFPITAYLLPGVTNTQFATEKVFWEVTRTSGAFDIYISTQSGALSPMGAFTPLSATTQSASISGMVKANQTTASTVAGTVASSATNLNLAAYTTSMTYTSGPAVVTVKLWVENVATSNGIWDELEWYTTKTVTFNQVSALGSAVTLTAPSAYDTVVTVSATVPTLNFSNLSGGFRIGVIADRATFATDAGTSTVSPWISGTTLTARAGVVSQSFALTNSGSVSPGTSMSAFVLYQASDLDNMSAASTASALAQSTVGSVALDAISISSVAAADVSGSATAYSVRQNKTFTVRVHASTNSVSLSGVAVSVDLSGGTALVTSSKEMSINGGAALTTLPSALSLTTGADGYATFTVTTTGFAHNETIVVDASVGNVGASAVTYTVKDPVYTIAGTFDYYVTNAGTSVDLPYTVTDQWGEKSTRTDQFLKVTKAGNQSLSYNPTVSYVAVSGGNATVAFLPQPATATGSATATVTLVRLANGTYTADGSSSVTTNVNVVATAATDAFGTGLAASYSSSVSYFPSTVSWTTVTANVANTGSSVVVTGTGLIFRVSAAADTSYSDAISLRAGASGTYSFQVASLLDGTHTMTLTNGAATTTSLLVIDAVSFSGGAAINFDTDSIDSGKTKIVVGTVVDANGNPVDTSTGNATILVTYAGTAGIPVGTMPTETDANGEFRISILTSAADSGTFTLTATYLKAGANTAAADKISKVQTVTVGAAAASSADQKITVGTFKGYVAIYTKGYMGQKLSAKVAGKWLVVDPIAAYKSNDYSRTVRLTGAGYTITVDLYIDGAFVRSEVVTTK